MDVKGFLIPTPSVFVKYLKSQDTALSANQLHFILSIDNLFNGAVLTRASE